MIEKNMDNSLIKIEGDSKALSSLIDAISRGIGTLYRPLGINREAKAKAEEIKILAKAKVKEQEILAEAHKTNGSVFSEEQLHHIVARIFGQELRRQENIDAIANIALAALDESKVLEVKEKVDTYWLTQYFNIVQDVSDDELRNAWGKILSQEIMAPGSCSLRTLNTVRNLSKKEAELFSSLGDFIIHSRTTAFLINDENSILGSQLKFSDVSLLMECGLIREEYDLHFSSESTNESNRTAWIYQDKVVFLVSTNKSLSVPVYELTTAGRELYKILTVSFRFDYLKQIAAHFKNIQFSYSQLISFEGDRIEHDKNVVIL